MSDNNNTNNSNNKQQYPFYIHDQYVKDLSFENPNVLLKYTDVKKQPEVSVNVETHVAKVQEDTYETTLKAVEKMANYDKDKIQASLKLIGAEAEMPKKLSAIVDVIKDRYNPAIYQKVVKEIAKMYS